MEMVMHILQEHLVSEVNGWISESYFSISDIHSSSLEMNGRGNTSCVRGDTRPLLAVLDNRYADQ